MIETKVNGAIGTIVLNRPDCENAVSLAMLEEIRQAIGDLHQEKRVRAVILTGAGESFCVGRDLQEMAADQQLSSDDTPPSPQRWGDEELEFSDLLGEFLAFPKPIVAAVNGPVAGFGVALAMACDYLLACEAAEIRLSGAQRGLLDGLAAPLVAYRVGVGLVSRLAVMGEAITASEALSLGLYQKLAKHDLLWAQAAEIGTQSLQGAPQAIGLTKRLLLDTVGEKLRSDLSAAAALNATARTTQAAREGLLSVVERREPVWD